MHSDSKKSIIFYCSDKEIMNLLLSILVIKKLRTFFYTLGDAMFIEFSIEIIVDPYLH